jgi:hypothetical protein
VIGHFGYRAVALQRLAFAKLLNSRLASAAHASFAYVPEELCAWVGLTMGCEHLLPRVLSDSATAGSELGRWVGVGGAVDRELHVQCLLLAIRSERVAMCRLLLGLQRSTDVTVTVRPRDITATVRWENECAEAQATSCLDVACRGAALPALQILRDMWAAACGEQRTHC